MTAHNWLRNAQNVGILYQKRAEQATDPPPAPLSCARPPPQCKKAYEPGLELNDQVNAAASYFQLGVLHLMLGELDQAEQHALQALQIRESLNLPDVYMSYGNLAGIARARGDMQAAAQWQAKRDAKVAELKS